MLAFRLDTAAMVQGIRKWMLPLKDRQVTQNGMPRDKCKISQLEKPGPLPTTTREKYGFSSLQSLPTENISQTEPRVKGVYEYFIQ